MLLFRPLIRLRIVASTVSPRSVCLQAAETIESLFKSYEKLYTLKRTPTLAFFFALTTHITGLAIAAFTSPIEGLNPHASPDQRVSQVLTQSAVDLEQTAFCHECARRAAEEVQSLVIRSTVGCEVHLSGCMGSGSRRKLSGIHTGYINAANELLRHCFVFGCAADGTSFTRKMLASEDVIKEKGSMPFGPFTLRNMRMPPMCNNDPERSGFAVL